VQTQRLAFPHLEPVCLARFLLGPHPVTCYPQVRVGHVAEGGRVETQRLAFHTGRAHKLALEPEVPTCFLSCGEDGAVRIFCRML
jgi:hypothetical protein